MIIGLQNQFKCEKSKGVVYIQNMILYFLLIPLFFLPLMGDLQEHIHPNADINRIGKISIDDRSSSINQGTWIYVKNALDYYKKNPPLFIILELNTPGGEVFVAQKISDALINLDTQYDIPIVAFINNWAISAGAMLAYSSRYIAVSKDASMGAAEPILQDASGETKTASEKVNSAIRADFANRASFFGRNPDIAEAMVDKDLILVKREGKIIKLDAESQVKPEDTIISPKGKLLTLDAAHLMEYGVADIALKPIKLTPLTEEERKKGIWPGAKEQLFQYPFFAAISHPMIDAYQMDIKTWLFVLLANPYVTSLLMLGMMMGFYIEFNHPGFGAPGILALTCLFLLTLSSFSLEIADWLEVILLLSGTILLVVDLFLLPTFGLVGTIGTVLFFAGLFGIILPGIGAIDFEFDTQTFNAAGEAFFNRLGLFLSTLLVGSLCIFFLARYIMPSFKTFRRFVLEGNEQVGYTAGIASKDLPPVGSIGIADSVLRPSGKVEIEGKIYDAVSRGWLIEKGAPIVVIQVEESQVVVEEKK